MLCSFVSPHASPRTEVRLRCTWILFIGLMLVYWMVGARRNKKRDKLTTETLVYGYEPGADVTDFQDKTFRYTT
jgi:hypothetical protein